MGFSSTESECELHFNVRAGYGPPRKKRKKVGKRASDKSKTDKWQSFEVNFHKRLAGHQNGCPYCLHDCLKKLEPLLDELKAWREERAKESTDVVDRELHWIFTSKVENEAPPSRLGRRLGKCNDLEDGSSTTTEEVCRASSTCTSNPENSDSDDRREMPVAPDRRAGYSRRDSSKLPSVRLDTFLKGSEKGWCMCNKAAAFALGVGQARLQRVPEKRLVVMLLFYSVNPF